ncbi:MAG: 4Fe-4S binding protein [Syntrophaceae bacterium]|nr:4Fe-4S binding protein [Syntrophaceae bacterium]
MRNLRRCIQGIFLLTFLFLLVQTESKGGDELGYPVKIFLDFDPLILISVLFSSHVLVKGFYFSLILIVITIFMGRVFCGWICPMGTLHNIVGAFNKRQNRVVKKRWFRLKYYILFFLLASSLFGVQLAGILDPVSLLIRSLSLSIYPLLNYMVQAIFDTIYRTNVGALVAVSEFIYTCLKKGVLAFQQPFFYQGVFIGILLLIIMALNLLEKRSWCRYLCPLGALLGILSSYSLLKKSISEGCASCGACEVVCSSAVDEDGRECLACMNCQDTCPEDAITFGFRSGGSTPPDVRRRGVLVSVAAGVFSVPFLRIAPLSRMGNFHPALIRPPGALDEEEFLTRCIRCGECMKVCLTNGLQPTLFEAGLEGIWTPRLVPRIGFCEYRCTLCGQVCPTGAIKQLAEKEKIKTKIGQAFIDSGRCLPHAHATPCIVCEEVCPTSEKAIWTEMVKVRDREGEDVILKQPKVDLTLCIGCGICEAMCPVAGNPAIYVISTGETRSEKNQILLQ